MDIIGTDGKTLLPVKKAAPVNLLNPGKPAGDIYREMLWEKSNRLHREYLQNGSDFIQSGSWLTVEEIQVLKPEMTLFRPILDPTRKNDPLEIRDEMGRWLSRFVWMTQSTNTIDVFEGDGIRQ